MSTSNRSKNPDPAAFVTLGGVPLHIELQWPFHRSTSGADFHVIHGTARLLNDAGQHLHAEFAANFSQTAVEALPSLEPEYAESVVINGVRMAVDAARLEFLKSGKRLPVEVSSRHLNLKTNQIRFLTATDDDIANFLQTKLYWLSARVPQRHSPLWIADPYDLQYLGINADKIKNAANELQQKGLCSLDGEFAASTDALGAMSERFNTELQKTLDRAVAKFNQTLVQS